MRLTRSSVGASSLSLGISARDLNGNAITTAPQEQTQTAEFIITQTIKVGDTIALGSTIPDATWRSTNSNIAAVSNRGTVTAVAAGRADIGVTAGDRTLRIRIIVTE